MMIQRAYSHAALPVSSLPCWRPVVPLKPLAKRRLSPRTTSVSTDTVTVVSEGAPSRPDVTDHSNASGPAAAPDPAPEAAGSFPWTSHWYPVAVVDDLDPRGPHAVHLLGIPMAVWRDKQGAWHAVEDKCPHRLAPLSEGRVEADGTLQCAYHGWQFNGTGACTHIPQLRADDKAQRVACSSARSCVHAFPVQLVHGLLWVLPDSSPEAHAKFARDPAPPSTAIKELMEGPEAEHHVRTTQWFARDLPIRWDTLCENIIDPSHVPFAHHGVQGRRESENGTTTKVDGIGMEGFSFQLDNKRFPPSRPLFDAPNFFRYGAGFRSLNVYAVPTRPGWSRLYATFLKDKRVRSPLPWFVDIVYSTVERTTWLEHTVQRNPVLDGDTYMLHRQERTLAEGEGGWRDRFFMPASADASVVAFRKWLDAYGGDVPTCEPGTPMPPPMTKREVLDRYSQHTVNCKHCKKALRNMDVATAVAAAFGLLAAAWLVARAAVGTAPLLAPATALGLLAVALSGAVVAALRSFRQQFFFVDYVHAEKN